MEVSEIAQTVEKAVRIIYFGLVYHKKILTNKEYQTLYKEYSVSSELQSYVKASAKSLELKIYGIGRDGVFISPTIKSPFSPRMAEIPVLGKEKNRGLYLLIIMGLAAYFFPNPKSFQTRGYSSLGVDAKRLHNFLMNTINSIIELKGEDIISESPAQPYIGKLFGEYYRMKVDSDTNPQSTTTYFLKKTLEHFQKERLLASDGEIFIPTSKFRLQMEEFSNNELYLEFLRSMMEPSDSSDVEKI